MKASDGHGRTALIAVGVLTALLAMGPVVAGLMGSRKSQNWYRFNLCRRNLACISYAVSNYSVAHDGHLPVGLEQVFPRYVSEIPTCPAAGIDTYTGGYAAAGKRYTIYCSGHNHAPLAPANFPQFGAEVGSSTVHEVLWPEDQWKY